MWEDKENYVFGFDWDWIDLIIAVSYLEATNSRLVDQWMNVNKDLAEEGKDLAAVAAEEAGEVFCSCACFVCVTVQLGYTIEDLFKIFYFNPIGLVILFWFNQIKI